MDADLGAEFVDHLAAAVRPQVLQPVEQVLDARDASYGITNYRFAIIQLAQTTLRSEIGKIDLDRTFEARATINAIRRGRGEKALSLEELRSQGAIEYIAFPQQLVGKYQSFTQADLTRLRTAGYIAEFMTVEEGAGAYVKALQKPQLEKQELQKK